MNDQDNQVHIPDFQQDLPVDEIQQEEFIAAMIQAIEVGAPIQVFQDLLNDAPSVSVEALYNLTARLLSHANVVRLLLEHEPKIARHKDPHGGLLLHKATSTFYDIPVDTIVVILDAYPEGISEKDSNGFLPLHLACEHGACIQTLELLFSRFPDAASVSVSHEDQNGHQFPLHCCLRNSKLNRSDSFVLTLIEAYPEAALVKTKFYETTLHLACTNSFSLVIVQRLYQLYPEAVTAQSGYGGAIPLHLACQSLSPSLGVVKFLLEKYPEGAGKLPLHSACIYGTSLDVLRLLLDHCGEERHHNGLSITDERGRLPIHTYARSQNARPDTLRYLLQLYPEGIHAVDNEGMLPIHHACDSEFPRLEIVRLLVEAAPFTVIQKSADRRTPLQCTPGRGHLRRNVEVQTYLREQQTEVVNAMKEAFVDVANAQLGLPDLVTANVWSFAKPDL